MPSTEKVSISITDPRILAWAKDRARRYGISLSAVFVEALASERQFELQLAAREQLFLASGVAAPTQKETLAILAEWDAHFADPDDGLQRKSKAVHRTTHPGKRPSKSSTRYRSKAKVTKRRA